MTPLPRADFSDLHAFEARQAFVKNIASGEAGINLADAALAIAAEDDALVSHSSVKLPVQAYAKRMQRMAEDIAHNRLDHFPSVGSDRDPTAVLEVHSYKKPKSFNDSHETCCNLCAHGVFGRRLHALLLGAYVLAPADSTCTGNHQCQQLGCRSDSRTPASAPPAPLGLHPSFHPA